MESNEGATRRGALRAAGVAGLAGLAGCLGGLTGGSKGGGKGPFGGHPAAAAIDDQPYRGPPPGEGKATIVAFEDPSCPKCKAFHGNTYPKIKSKLTDPGTATFVFRGYPVVYEWGKPATKALEATLARNEAAHWTLLDAFFAAQGGSGLGSRSGGLSKAGALRVARNTLDRKTDVDGAAVVDAVKAGEADAAVRTDLDAGKQADANATPALYLFKNGKFRTKATSSVSYETVAAALGL